MFGVTAHWIKKNSDLKEAILALKTIEGPHTGTNLAALLQNTLHQYHISWRLYFITANNASNDATMAAQLHKLIPHFDPFKDIRGCVAHVINLVAS